MTTIKELIATLQTRKPNAQVYRMTTRKQPFENHLLGVVGREEMLDQAWRIEPGIAPDDVLLVTGKRIRPGSLSAWIIAERRQLGGERGAAAPMEFSGRMAEALTGIAREHLGIDTLDDASWDSANPHEVSTAGLRDVLRAAYLTGRADREAEPSSENDQASQGQAGADSGALPPGAEPEQLGNTQSTNRVENRVKSIGCSPSPSRSPGTSHVAPSTRFNGWWPRVTGIE
jgi:hypothetical protein